MLARAIEAAGGYDLLVLDEAISAQEAGLLEAAALPSWLESRPPTVEVVLTGRGNCGNLLPFAQYVSEIKQRAHPYTKGEKARKGIEF